MRPLIILVTTVLFATGQLKADTLREGELIHALNAQLTEVIITDGFSPPAAARIYCYVNMAAYECLVPFYSGQRSLKGQINGYKGFSHHPDTSVDRDRLLVMLFVGVSKELVYRIHIMDHFMQSYLSQRRDLDKQTIRLTEEMALQLKQEHMAWIGQDNYRQLKEGSRYVPFKGPQFWEPTPPAYMDALEPNWNLLRPLVIRSPKEVAVLQHATFDTTKTSKFYTDAVAVHDAVKSLTDDQLQIAKFWDCNPLQTQTMGHFNFASRQLTPGGHWLGIIRICARKQHLDLISSMEAYTLVSIGLFDGFLTAWADKYSNGLIRPETYINRYMDPDWRPILETPPFPEHPSAHSVISGTAAYILTNLWGEGFSFEDDTELDFGLPVRVFNSFSQAADEAAISRLYGGIHFMPAIENGKKAGVEIGKLVWARVKTKG
jgi:hypothetical protein